MSQSGGFCGVCGTTLTSKYSPCPNCGHTKTTYNPQSAGRSGGHCGQCGAPLASKYATCPNCGHTKTTYSPQPAGGASGHCGQCGAALASKYAPCPKCGYIKTKYEPGKSRSTRPVMIASIVFAGLISTIIGIDLYATQSLELQPMQNASPQIDYSTLTIHFQLSIYNPTVIPTSFDVIHADILYKSKTLGTATIYGKSLPPSSYTDVSAKFELGSVSTLMEAFGGGTPDKEDFSVKVKLEKRILGFIPFMYERNYTMDEFSKNFSP